MAYNKIKEDKIEDYEDEEEEQETPREKFNKKDTNKFKIVNIPTQTKPAVYNEGTGEAFSITEALCEILNKLEKLERG